MILTRIPAFVQQIVFVAVLWSLILRGELQGATYTIAFDGPTTISAGAPFALQVYLLETLSPGEPTILGDSNYGLISGSFLAQITSGGSSFTQVSGSSQFDNYGGALTAGPWIVSQADLDPTDGTPVGTPFGDGQYRLQLGTIEGVGSLYNESTRIRINNLPSVISDDLLLGDGTSLDASVFPSSQWTIRTEGGLDIPVPEPATLVTWSVGLGLVAYLRQRRKLVAANGN
jgi:hypothetical protein